MDFVRSYYFPYETLTSWTLFHHFRVPLNVPQIDERSVELVRGSFGKKWLCPKSIFELNLSGRELFRSFTLCFTKLHNPFDIRLYSTWLLALLQSTVERFYSPCGSGQYSSFSVPTLYYCQQLLLKLLGPGKDTSLLY